MTQPTTDEWLQKLANIVEEPGCEEDGCPKVAVWVNVYDNGCCRPQVARCIPCFDQWWSAGVGEGDVFHCVVCEGYHRLLRVERIRR